MQLVTTDKVWSMEPGALERLHAFAQRVDLSALMGGMSEEPVDLLSVVDNVGIIDVRGTITRHPSWFHVLFGGGASIIQVGRALEAAIDEPTISSIMLRVDSPGGSVEGVTDLADQIFAARSEKPIVAQIDGTGASAAYWLASQAHRVYMGKTDQVGSIGVKTVLYDYSEAFAARGIETIPISTGKYKTSGEMGTKITKSDKDYFRGMVDAYFAEFEGAVKRGRSMSEADFGDVADGRVFIGADGINRGLVDAIRSPTQTLASMLAGDETGETRAASTTRHARARWKAARTGVNIGV